MAARNRVAASERRSTNPAGRPAARMASGAAWRTRSMFDSWRRERIWDVARTASSARMLEASSPTLAISKAPKMVQANAATARMYRSRSSVVMTSMTVRRPRAGRVICGARVFMLVLPLPS
jgi:hypothetical protein